MGMIFRFEELRVWQKARILCRRIYQLTLTDLFAKDFKLKQQINGSAGSIMDNIAEGFGRNGNNEFVQYINIANGSAMETKSQLYRAFDRKYLTEENFHELQASCDEISKMLFSLMKYLRKSNLKGQKSKLSEEKLTNSEL